MSLIKAKQMQNTEQIYPILNCGDGTYYLYRNQSNTLITNLFAISGPTNIFLPTITEIDMGIHYKFLLVKEVSMVIYHEFPQRFIYVDTIGQTLQVADFTSSDKGAFLDIVAMDDGTVTYKWFVTSSFGKWNINIV